MNFLSVFKKEKEKRDFFLALIFKPHSIGSILFEEKSGKLLIIAFHEEKTNSPVDTLTEKELTQTCDTVISSVEKYLEEDIFVKKTIFGIPHNWVEENRIKRTYLIKFKKICDELDLTPVGFIVSLEAVVNFLQKKEGAPISGIFVEVLKESVVVCLVKAGNVLGIKSENIEKNYLQAVESALKEFHGVEVLPSRIILLETEGAEIKQQEFLSYPWMQELPFLHFPKVMLLEKGWENEAIISGVGSQMGFDMLEDKTSQSKAKEDAGEEDSEEDFSEDIKEEKDKVPNNDFGFLKDEDILEKKEEGKDFYEDEDNINKSIKEDKKKIKKLPFSFSYVSGIFLKAPYFILNKILSFPKAFKSGSLFKFPLGAKTLIIFIAFILSGVVFSYFYYSFILGADVVLFLDKKEIKKTLDIALSSDKETSFKNASLNISLVDHEEEGDIIKKTTGKKETGEKAKGEVVVYNKTEQKKTFAKGTILLGANKLQFELEDDLIIASTSAFSTSFSSAKGKVVAANFGEEYNLPSETNFTFKDLPSSNFFGKNESAFSGGSKREINVVSEKDLEALSKDILEKLRAKAQESIKSKIGKDDMLLPFIISEEFVKKEFSKKENEEANEIKIKAKIKFQGAYYKKAELNNFEEELAKEEIPSDFHLDKSKSKVEIKNIEMNKNKSITATLDTQSIYLPQVDVNQVVQYLTKKRTSEGEEKIKDIKNISDYKFIFKNKIDFLPDFLPFNSQNIHVVTRIND